MNVTLLGTGCMVPDPERGSPGTLVTREGAHVLIDAGPGTYRRLLEIGVYPTSLDAILLSHHHPDHTADLGGILAGIHNALIVQERTVRTPLWILGGPGFLDFFGRLEDLYRHSIDLSERRPLEVVEVAQGKDFELAGFRVSAIPVPHATSSVAFRLEADGTVLVYTGDTGFSEELSAFAEGSDLVIAECSFPDEIDRENHMTPAKIHRFARAAGPKRLVLVHFYPGWTLDPRVFEELETEVIEGRDLLTIRL